MYRLSHCCCTHTRNRNRRHSGLKNDYSLYSPYDKSVNVFDLQVLIVAFGLLFRFNIGKASGIDRCNCDKALVFAIGCGGVQLPGHNFVQCNYLNQMPTHTDANGKCLNLYEV